MLYMPASVPLVGMVEALQEYILQHHIQFLIVDSLARASGGSITDEEGVGMMFEAIRQLELPCLCIHHTNRGDDYYGSPYIRANARNIWRLRSAASEGLGRLSMQLQQEKENDGPGVGSLGFVLEFKGDPFDPESVVLSAQDASLIPELRKHARLWQQLQASLTETPNHRMEIATIGATLNLDKSRQETLRNYIWALRNETGKYKKLAELMHVNGDWLALNTPEGMEGVSELPETNTATETQSTPVVPSVSGVSLNSTTGDLGWGDVTEEIDSISQPIKKEVIW